MRTIQYLRITLRNSPRPLQQVDTVVVGYHVRGRRTKEDDPVRLSNR